MLRVVNIHSEVGAFLASADTDIAIDAPQLILYLGHLRPSVM